MSVIDIVKQQGWEPVTRQGWIAVQDHRPEFRAAYTTNRVGKIIDTSFYVTLTQLPEVTKGLVRQLDLEVVSIKSTSGSRDATYWGFDTKGIAEEQLKAFFKRLADSINDLL